MGSSEKRQSSANRKDRMVKMKALRKDSMLQIKNSWKRFLSILLMALLGVGFFAGIKATSPDMEVTLDEYFDKYNVYDIQILSTLGLSENDIEAISKVEGIEGIYPTYSTDIEVETKEKNVIVKAYAYSQTDINKFELIEGRVPEEGQKECVVEEKLLTRTGLKIGDTIKAVLPEDSILKENTFTIVGTISSPLYISSQRGSSKLGSGVIDCYIYIEEDCFDSDVYTEAYSTLEGAKQLNTFSKKYDTIVSNINEALEEVKEKREEERYQEIKDEANEKIRESQDELDKAKKEADEKIAEAEDEIAQGEKEIKNAESKVNSSKKELANAQNQINDSEAELLNKEKEFNESKPQIEAQIAEGEAGITTLEQGIEQINLAIAQIESSYEGITDESLLAQKNQQIQELEKNKAELEQTLSQTKAQIEAAKKQLSEAEAQIASGKAQIAKNKKEIENGLAKLVTAQNEIQANKKKIEDAKITLAEEKQKAEEEILDAQKKIDDAKLELETLEKPKWYILGRESNAGYSGYKNDAQRIANIGKVFPIVFFVVATLISLTSMTRMVEEQRLQIGTLKALGYKNTQIAKKYITYAALATILGSAVGVIIGLNFLPRIIFMMYKMMYNIGEIIVEFNIYYSLLGFGIAFACIVGATIASCYKELKQMPAQLMRPKAPKPGKRVLLEKIPFIWKHLNFTHKVTARNLFRYKKRFLMTIIGICGCTALILAGFGLKYSVSTLIPLQYEEIYRYDMSVSVKEDADIYKKLEEIKIIEGVENGMAVGIHSGKVEGEDIQIIVAQDMNALKEFITLRDENGELHVAENEVILSEKIAKIIGCEVGDLVTLENSDEIAVEVKIGAITENYLYHYAYLSAKDYETLYGQQDEENVILLRTESTDIEDELATKILADTDAISGVTRNSTAIHIMDDTMKNMDYVVWVLIVAAGLLALVVLYNLSNINISERIRELATIKVLGFYDKEVYSYVTNETIILTILGIILGLVGGYLLNFYILETCELDIMSFNKTINMLSYVYAAVITLVFATVVNIATYFRLKKIDMIESLKSVE